MGFMKRNLMSKKFEQLMDDFLKLYNFDIVDISYERIFPEDIRNNLRRLYNVPEIIYVRFQPDRFAFLNDKNSFLIEYKICNTPIQFDKRIEELRRISGDNSLSKENVGAIESTAFQHYLKLQKNLNLRIILIIYSSFNQKKILAEFIDNIKIKNESNVIYGFGNASKTPYVNINLDELRRIDKFLQEEFKISVSEDKIKKIIQNMEG